LAPGYISYKGGLNFQFTAQPAGILETTQEQQLGARAVLLHQGDLPIPVWLPEEMKLSLKEKNINQSF
jgi:hypothetical protein